MMNNTIVVGDITHPEFSAPLALLARVTDAQLCANCHDALAALEESPDCDLLIAAQALPNSISPGQWNQLRAAAPTTPALSLLGNWCEGDERTGTPLEGAQRVYWHAFEEFLLGQLARIQRGEAPLWAAPQTASAADHLLARRVEPAAVAQAIVSSRDAELARLLVDVLSRGGWRVSHRAWHDASISSLATLVLWDAPDGTPAALQEFQSLRKLWTDSPVVVLASFPRAHQVALWRQAGASRVLSKPLYIDELLQTASALAKRLDD